MAEPAPDRPPVIRLDRSELSPEEHFRAVVRDHRRAPAPRRARTVARSRLTFALGFSALEGAAVCATLQRYCHGSGLSLLVQERVSRRDAVLEGEAVGEASAVLRLEGWLRAHCRAGELRVTPVR
jgi:hypothetical protein